MTPEQSKPLVGYPEAQETLSPKSDWKSIAKKLADALDKMPCITSGHQKVKDEALQEYYKLKSI